MTDLPAHNMGKDVVATREELPNANVCEAESLVFFWTGGEVERGARSSVWEARSCISEHRADRFRQLNNESSQLPKFHTAKSRSASVAAKRRRKVSASSFNREVSRSPSEAF